jgi:sigma-B regulation protein RsbU (phosphoserine phosphatase)
MYSDTSDSARSLEEEETVLDPSSSSRPHYRRRSDLFHTLHADHEEVLRLFSRLTAARSVEHQTRWGQLSFMLTAHTHAEHEVVYARYQGSPTELQPWLEEHEELEALMVEIDALPLGDVSFLPKVGRLKQLVEQHIVREEQKLLPRLEALMSVRDLDLISLRFEQRKRRIERELEAWRVIPFADEPYLRAQERYPSYPPASVRELARPNGFLQARILIVDDQRTNLHLLQRILATARYARVQATVDPTVVFDLHRRNPYDLILLDLDMPRMSGFEVMEGLRALEPDLPVIALASEPAQQLAALRAGAKDFLCKPFERTEVLERVAVLLGSRLPELERRQRYRSLERDFALAAEIYRALLPSSIPCVPGYEIAVFSQPADETSGDVYDVIARPDGTLVLLLADATGHGLGPALSATQLRSMVRIGLRFGAPLETLVAEAYRLLAADLPPDRFVTAFIGELDPATHTLTYLAPGQGPLLHWHTDLARAEWRNASGPPFGVADLPFEPPAPMRMAVGDVVILATDGMFERANDQGQLFGKAGVESVLRDAIDSSAQSIAQLLRARTEHHAGAMPWEDDVTILVVKRTA